MAQTPIVIITGVSTHEDVIDGVNANFSDAETRISALEGSSGYSEQDLKTYLNGNLDTHIIPDTNSSYDLGSAEKKFRHLYLSDNTIYFGENESSLKVSQQGDILVNGEIFGAVTVQNLGELPPQDLPFSNTIDDTAGPVAVGHLIGNTVLTLSGASAGDSGMIILSNGPTHDGVGFTVDFFIPFQGSFGGNSGQHIVVNGDLADFAAAPAAGQFNLGTIAWFYDGFSYFIYVSNVLTSTDPIPLPTP